LKILKVLAVSVLSLATCTAQAAPYQLYLVRHAHKAEVNKAAGGTAAKDPLLSACGKAQAAALATLMAKVPLTKLYHSGYQRTQLTATALLTPNRRLETYPAADIQNLAASLMQQQQNALVVGHSNTVPQLAELLSKTPQAPLTEQDYGLIYQLQFDGNNFISLTTLQLPMPALCEPQKGLNKTNE